jgi:hypothetical protein
MGSVGRGIAEPVAMSSMSVRSRSWQQIQRACFALCCISLAGPGASAVLAQEKPQAADSTAALTTVKISPEELDALVAPIALYPDDLLAQTLVASTYPLEIVQLQQWLTKHPKLKDKALADSVAKQPWDPAIQSMAAVPEVVKRLADDVQWSTDLGNAFLAQQGDVMDAVQRMRKKAEGKGALKSNEQQKVETKVVEKDTVIIVQQTNPEVIYVPTYSPTVVYGPPVYPYPPIYYPPYPPGAAFVTFSVGVMWGAAMWGGSCCHAGWGHGNTVVINNNNHYNQINHNGNRGGNNNWQHNAEHRGGAPYGDKGTANKYGGSARGGSNKAAPSQQPSRGGQSQRGGASPSTQPSRGGAGGGAGASPSTQPSRGGAGASTAKGGGGGVPKTSSAMSGGSRGYSGSGARASSSRGTSSMGGRGGGGGGRRR